MHFTSRLILVTGLAFATWLVLQAMLSRARMPFAGVIAAVVSWACASLWLGWTVEVLKRAGWWPL